MTRAPREKLSVERVTDFQSEDLLVALELYNAMIPAEERQGSPSDIIRQLQHAQDKRANGLYKFDDYHFVAKLASRVCGYMQLYFHPEEKFAFVGFLVVRASVGLGPEQAWVASRMCKRIAEMLERDDAFHGCVRFFLELDDPRRASDERKKRRAIKRIERFEAICTQCGRELRFLDHGYLTARLGLPEDEPTPEQPHLLGYVSRCAEASMDREVVRHVLGIIYTQLNPEGVYDDDSEKEQRYRHYLKEFCAKERADVPATVQLLNARQTVRRAMSVPPIVKARGDERRERPDDKEWILVSQAVARLSFVPNLKALYKFAKQHPDKLRVRKHPQHPQRRQANAADVLHLEMAHDANDFDALGGTAASNLSSFSENGLSRLAERIVREPRHREK